MSKRLDKVTTIIATTIVAVFLIVSASNAGERRVVDRVVAVVAGEVITLSELTDYSRLVPDLPLDQVLEKVIEEKLIEIEARRQGIEVTEVEIDAAIETQVAKLGVEMGDFEEILKQEGLTLEKYREKLRAELTKVKYMKGHLRGEVEVTEEETLNYYRRHPEQFRGEAMVHIARIFLPVPLEADARERRKVNELANEIISRVAAGEEFAKLAKKYSRGSNAPNGGDLGWMRPDGLIPAFKTAVASMEVGDVSGVIELRNGLNLLYMVEKKSAGVTPFEDVKEKIYQILYSQKVGEEINKIVSNLKLEVPIERML